MFKKFHLEHGQWYGQDTWSVKDGKGGIQENQRSSRQKSFLTGPGTSRALLGLPILTSPHRLEYFWYFTGCIVIWFWIQFWNVKCYELNLWKPHGKRTLVFEAILNKWISQNTLLHHTKNNSYIKYGNFSFIWKGLYQNLVFEAQQKL